MPAESKYNPDFCQKMIDHCDKGHSFTSFAHKIGIGRRTLYDWVKKIPEFAVAYELAWVAGLTFWEDMLMAATLKQTKQVLKKAEGQLDPKDIMAILKTRYREEYAERREVHNTGSMTMGGVFATGHLEGDELRKALDDARAQRRAIEDRIASYGGSNPFEAGDSGKSTD